MQEAAGQAKHHVTAREDRVPIFQKAIYSIGGFVNSFQAAALGAMVIVLNLGLGMNPALVGLVGFIPRIFDAITDPITGYISDNIRTPWGRRKPIIFLGAIAGGIFFALMFQLYQGRSEAYYFWYFLAFQCLFFLGFTCFSIPWIALGYEMTPDYHERTRLQGMSNFIAQFAWVIAPWFFKIMQNKNIFPDLVHGARALAIIVGAMIAIGGMLPAIFNKERYADLPKVKRGKGLWNVTKDFFKGFAVTFKCGPFVKLCAATFLIFNGFMLASAFSAYVIFFYVYGGDYSKGGTLLGWFGTFSSVCTFCVILIATKISTMIGKKNAILVTLSISVVGYALKWIGYNPQHPYLLLIAAPFMAFGLGSLFTLVSSMVADVCDLDECSTDTRREGMYSAVYWWMVKLGLAVSSLISGFLLNASGFNIALGANQTTRALLLMRVFDIGIAMVTTLIAIFILASFPLSEQHAFENRQFLERRREERRKAAEQAAWQAEERRKEERRKE